MSVSIIRPDLAARDEPASARLSRLASQLPGANVTIDRLLDVLGPSGPSLALVLFAAVTLIPGIAPVFGAGLCLLGINLLLGGERLWLPDWLRSRSVACDKLARGIARLVPRLQRMERVMQPRRPGMLRGPGLRAAGLAVLANGVMIVLPIPFGNTAPALAALLLALALTARDGTAVLAGIGATGLAVLLDTALVFVGYKAVLGLLGLV